MNSPGFIVPVVIVAAAVNLVPSVEEAMEDQLLLGAVVCTHVAPKSLETKIPPLADTAASLVPSEEDTAQFQTPAGAWAVLQGPEYGKLSTHLEALSPAVAICL
jgi:hypothetical protein